MSDTYYETKRDVARRKFVAELCKRDFGREATDHELMVIGRTAWEAGADWARGDAMEAEQMKLAACGVAALCNTEQTIKEQRIDRGNPYWSASYGDVCNAVDREIALRTKLAIARAALEHVQCQCTLMERESGHLVACWNEPARMALAQLEEKK